MTLFHPVVIVNEQPVEDGILSQHLLDKDDAAVVVQSLMNRLDQGVPIQGPHELQRQNQQHHRGVFDPHALVQISADQFQFMLETVRGHFLAALFQHLRRIIHTDEFDAPGDRRIQVQQGRASGAAQVVDVRSRDGKIPGHFGDHPLHLLIERRAVQHVVEHGGDVLAEGEVRNGLGLAEDFIPGGSHGFQYGFGKGCGHSGFLG